MHFNISASESWQPKLNKDRFNLIQFMHTVGSPCYWWGYVVRVRIWWAMRHRWQAACHLTWLRSSPEGLAQYLEVDWRRPACQMLVHTQVTHAKHRHCLFILSFSMGSFPWHAFQTCVHANDIISFRKKIERYRESMQGATGTALLTSVPCNKTYR